MSVVCIGVHCGVRQYPYSTINLSVSVSVTCLLLRYFLKIFLSRIDAKDSKGSKSQMITKCSIKNLRVLNGHPRILRSFGSQEFKKVLRI